MEFKGVLTQGMDLRLEAAGINELRGVMAVL